MKTVLITGANRGIGLAHTRRYAERGAIVYATSRGTADEELKAFAANSNGQVRLLAYEARDPQAPAAIKAAIGKTPLDLLFCNAGALQGQSFGSVDVDTVLDLIRVNALAPMKLAEALANNIAASDRKLIAFQSSLMGSIGDNGSGGYYAYRLAKNALNMIAKNVANDLRGRGVLAVALHPGWVQTRMGGASAKVTLDQCVAGQQKILDELTPAESGRFYNYDGRELPW